MDQSHQIAAQKAAKIVHPYNPSVSEVRDVTYTVRPETRDITPSVKLDLLLGVYMLATASEFKGTGDPRPSMIDADTAQHLRKLLEQNGVQVEKSIDLALNRKSVAA